MNHRCSVVMVVVIAILAVVSGGCDDYGRCVVFGGNWTTYFEWTYGDTIEAKEKCCRCEYGGRVRAAAASPGEVLYLAATAHVGGALGTDWRSDVELHNLGDDPAVVTVWLLVHGADNSSPQGTQLTVPSGTSVRLADMLAGQFGRDGQAAVMLSVGSGRLLATSRTYNLLAAGNPLGLPGGSTFGQYIPALERNAAIEFGEQGRLIQLSHSTAASGGFRTNLGLVNVTSSSLQVEVELHTADGALLGTVPVTLPPFGYQQLNRVFASVTSGDVDDGYAVVRTTTELGRFFAYASVVDNLTGDPIAITAVKLPAAESPDTGEPIYVVAAAHLGGIGGTNWRTDAEIHNLGDATAAFRIELLEHGVDNSSPSRAESYTLGAGQSLRLEDLLDSEFGFSGAAALRITPTAGHVLVTSRTYNLLGAGNSAGLPEGATFGQYIPGVTMNDAIHQGEEGRLIQLSHTPGGASGFRTNLVLVNATVKQIEVEVGLYGSDGTLLGTTTRTLAPYEYRQLNAVFELVTGAAVADGYAVVRTTTAGGAVFALASVVDNLTGDPVGLGAAVVLSPEAEDALGEVEGVMDVLGQTTIESTVDGIQLVGIDGMLDTMVAGQSDIATRTAGGFVIDYGSGTVMPDGSVLSGTTTVDASGLSATSSGITGTMTVTHDDVREDGEPVAVGSTAWTFDLDEREDGTVAGTISVEPRGASAADGALGGTIVLDSALCEKYPISGSLTLVHRGELITIAPSPECNGGTERDVVVMAPSIDFALPYGNPADPRALAFVTSTTNALIADEGVVRYWRPMVGGETFETTTPGVITHHFGFDRPVVGGRLRFRLAVWHFSYSQGRAFLFGSTNGTTWQQLSEVPPADSGQARGGGWDGPLPEMFLGATDIWLEARLYSYGPSASRGGIYCNTAQFSRWDPRQTFNTFELEVDLQDQ
jgi:hypothetical protein